MTFISDVPRKAYSLSNLHTFPEKVYSTILLVVLYISLQLTVIV